MSASATPKSVLIGKHCQHEADLLSKGCLCKGESRIVSTQQTCHDEPNMTRRGQEVSHSRFCNPFSILDAFLLTVTLHFALLHIYIIPSILLQLIIQRSFSLETFNRKRVCDGRNL